MAVYEDDPRTKPKLQSYGGSSNRSAAKRGEPRESTGSVPGAKKDPRLPAAPRQSGPDRQDWGESLPRRPVENTPLHRGLREASTWIDATIRELMRRSSPGSYLMEKQDSKNKSKPSLLEMLKIQSGSNRNFNRGEDKGIYANPRGRIPVPPPQTTGKFGPGHLPPYIPVPKAPRPSPGGSNSRPDWMDV